MTRQRRHYGHNLSIHLIFSVCRIKGHLNGVRSLLVYSILSRPRDQKTRASCLNSEFRKIWLAQLVSMKRYALLQSRSRTVGSLANHKELLLQILKPERMSMGGTMENVIDLTFSAITVIEDTRLPYRRPKWSPRS